MEPLIKLMKEVGQANGGKSCAQVAINWTLCKGEFCSPSSIVDCQAAELLALSIALSSMSARQALLASAEPTYLAAD